MRNIEQTAVLVIYDNNSNKFTYYKNENVFTDDIKKAKIFSMNDIYNEATKKTIHNALYSKYGKDNIKIKFKY